MLQRKHLHLKQTCEEQETALAELGSHLSEWVHSFTINLPSARTVRISQLKNGICPEFRSMYILD